MKIKEIINELELHAPVSYQESYDNSGLVVGDESTECNGVLIALDCTENVLEEAIASGCNMIVTHHPVIFGKGLMRISEHTFTGRLLSKAIRNNLAIYSSHTNLDNVFEGVSKVIAARLGIKNPKILRPIESRLRKLVVFVPVADAEKIREAMFIAGGGHIGNYSECSFNVMGTGTFKAMPGANPTIGKIGVQKKEQEIRMEMIFPFERTSAVIGAMKAAHPYEEVAYDIYKLENSMQTAGSGAIGELERDMNPKEFLDFLKHQMKTDCIRHTAFHAKKIRKIAVCGGSGSFLLPDAIAQAADVLVTADFKYHQFFDADSKIIIADIGHYESEQFTIELIRDILKKKFPTFALRLSKTNTNPINYHF